MNISDGRIFWLQSLVALALLLAQPAFSKDLAPLSGQVLLSVTGKIEKTNGAGAALFDQDMLSTFPAHRIETHTPWTDGIARFDGILLKDVLAAIGARGDTLFAQAINGYRIAFPISDAEEYGVLLAMRMDGRTLSRRDKGPLWIVYPRDDIAEIRDERYDSRWVWQLSTIEVR